mgnify:CR=1 FL=1
MGLSNYLVAAGFPEHTLPPSAQRSRWLLNHKHKADAESVRRSGAAASSQHAPGEEQRPRAELLQRNLHQWPEQEPDAHAALFLVNDPPCQMTANRMCIPFASRGMCNVLRWIADPQVVVFVDTKQSCMAHGWGVITASIAVRGKLRYTTLGRSEGRRVQAGAYTSHAAPVLQAIINVEKTQTTSCNSSILSRDCRHEGCRSARRWPRASHNSTRTRCQPHQGLPTQVIIARIHLRVCVCVSLSISLHVYS